MRKAVSLLLAICLLCASCALVLQTGAYTLGDLNNDGKINAIDASLLSVVIVGGQTSRLARKNADFNGDGKINARDNLYIKNIIIGA